MKTKVKALTLNEMVIVMIITTIVVGLAFSVLSLVQRHMWSIQENFNLNTEFNRLEQSLWVDSNQYSVINYSPRENIIIFKTEIDSISYQFSEHYVLRELDTFHLSIEQKEFFFAGKITKQGNVDAFRLKLSKKFKDQQLFVFKTNDAKQFVD